jgi:hypothetical protein
MENNYFRLIIQDNDNNNNTIHSTTNVPHVLPNQWTEHQNIVEVREIFDGVALFAMCESRVKVMHVQMLNNERSSNNNSNRYSNNNGFLFPQIMTELNTNCLIHSSTGISHSLTTVIDGWCKCSHTIKWYCIPGPNTSVALVDAVLVWLVQHQVDIVPVEVDYNKHDKPVSVIFSLLNC